MAKHERVLVAMSGGVDSAIAAALLKEQGFEVIGVHLLLWKPGWKTDSAQNDLPASNSADFEEISRTESARKTAAKLGIEFHLLDLRKQFLEQVAKPFVKEYLQGRTPNPCPICNLKIKFRTLLELADQLSAKYIASGHYARIVFDASANEYQLLEAISKDKDQSYFLFSLNQEVLTRMILPLWEMNKSMVRKQAQELGLASASAKESQDVCFALSGNYAKLVESFNPGNRADGEIVDLSGNVLGFHKGPPA